MSLFGFLLVPESLLTSIHDRLGRIETQLRQHASRTTTALASLNHEVDTMQLDYSKLAAAIEQNTSVDQSAVLAIQGLADMAAGLKQQIAELIAQGDTAAIQAAIDAYADQLAASTGTLAAAVTANTQPPAPAAEG